MGKRFLQFIVFLLLFALLLFLLGCTRISFSPHHEGALVSFRYEKQHGAVLQFGTLSLHIDPYTLAVLQNSTKALTEFADVLPCFLTVGLSDASHAAGEVFEALADLFSVAPDAKPFGATEV